MSNAALQYLSFLLDDNEFAIHILRIQEIRGYEKTKSLPNAPGYVVGVINLRGSVIPVIDLRIRFGLSKKEYTPTTVVIVVHIKVQNRYRKVGLIVDSVKEVYEVKETDIQDCTSIVENIDNRFVSGIATIGEAMVTIIDLDQVFNFKEIESALPAGNVSVTG
ncbi:MAG: chemotaxis protein CheW [Gammaproteobacteria bacterium]|nr:chemotaxis protein CheW [Gammaproteobacteria bacterium]